MGDASELRRLVFELFGGIEIIAPCPFFDFQRDFKSAAAVIVRLIRRGAHHPSLSG